MKIKVTDYNEDASPVDVIVELSPNYNGYRMESLDIVKITRGKQVYHSLEELEQEHSDEIVREIEKEMEYEIELYNRR